jgi:hypothetical protein
MKFNINNYVSVVLTQTGADIFNANEEYWENILPQGSSRGIRYKVGDTMRAQMWHMFQLFGPHIHLGGEIPFYMCEIDISVEDLR